MLSGTLSIANGGSKTTVPSGPEQLRLRLTVLQNALIMIKLKHPGRAELADVTFAVFEHYEDYLTRGTILLRPPLQRGVGIPHPAMAANPQLRARRARHPQACLPAHG